MKNASKMLLIDGSDNLETISEKLNIIIDLIKNHEEVSCKLDDKLFTNADVQKLLKISSSTLQSYRTKGKIGFIKRGRKVYYKQGHIQEFLNEKKSSNSQILKI